MAKQTADIYSVISHPDNSTVTLSFSEVVHELTPDFDSEDNLVLTPSKYVEDITSFRMSIKDAAQLARTILGLVERVGK